MLPCAYLFDEDEKKDWKVHAVYIIAIIASILVVISQFNNMYYYFDGQNLYHRNIWHPISLLLPMICILMDLILLIQRRSKISKQTFISLVNIAIGISMIFAFISFYMEQEQELIRKEQETYKLRVKVVLSQIGPHFIYNTLGTIKHLCKTDPQMAAETVDEFSAYLRGNIDSLSREEMITFSQELSHVQNYMAIEKKRFGDRILVLYDIEDEEFLLPALTLQPIVENAVKHGILRRTEGGTIWISSYKTEQGHCIEVRDDGIGYEKQQIENDGRVHVGIANVAQRIEMMCHGTFEIIGEKDKGTMVRMTISEQE